MAEEIIVIDATVDVTIGTTTNAHWVTCQNTEVLENEKHRGEDRILPGIAGVSGNPRVHDAVVHTLQLVIRGTSHSNLRTNIRALKAATQPVTTGTGTRTVTWTDPDVNVFTAACHVGPLVVGKFIGPNAVRATLEIQLDAGVWTEVP